MELNSNGFTNDAGGRDKINNDEYSEGLTHFHKSVNILDKSESKVELTLSRSCYNIGDTVVGTVRLIAGTEFTSATNTENAQENRVMSNKGKKPSHSPFKEAIVYITGKCRLDTRWHNYHKIAELYGTHPILENLPIEDPQYEQSKSKQTVCFFATNFVNLIELQRKSPENEKQQNDRNNGTMPEHNGFTFRVDLPQDIPPSAKALCCRYFYSAIAMVQLHSGEIIKTQIPFSLQTSACLSYNPYNNTRSIFLQQPTHNSSNARIQIGHCSATPYLPPTPTPLQKLNHSSSRIAVSRLSGLGSIASSADIRSIRITNQEGLPCCIMTIIGAKIMTPGGSILLQFHFEPDIVFGRNIHDENIDEDSKEETMYDADLLSCLQIGICLYGEEWTVHNKEQGQKNKARSFIFDTAHSYIEHESVDTVAMTLTLPMDCPCTFKTDLVETNIYCRMELTVEERQTKNGSKSKKKGRYEMLRLELPCDVVHNVVNDEIHEDEDETDFSSLDVFKIAEKEKKVLATKKKKQSTSIIAGNEEDIVLTRDILGDLTMLAFKLAS